MACLLARLVQQQMGLEGRQAAVDLPVVSTMWSPCCALRLGWMVVKAGGHPALVPASWPGGLRPAFGLGTEQGEGDGENTLHSLPASLSFQPWEGFHGTQLLYQRRSQSPS